MLAFHSIYFNIVLMYDVSKETDKDFLRAALKKVQEQNILMAKELALRDKQKIKDEELCKKLAEELFLLRKSIYDSKAERREKSRELARERREREKKRKKKNLPHNQSENEPPEEDCDKMSLDEEIEKHTLEDEGKCPKCGEEDGFSPMNSSEESGEIEVVERRYIFKRHQRQKYHCKCCKSIVTAPGGAKLTPGGEFSIQIATQVAGDKFQDHIPLNRQQSQMAREGLKVGTRTLFGLTEHLYNLLFGLNELIRQDVLGGHWVHIDESPMPFYNSAKSRGYIWSMSNNRSAYYQFEPNRRGEVAEEMLKGYCRGVVVTDGFSGYNFLDKLDEVKHAFCWSHVLRKFVDSLNFSDSAKEVVGWIDNLYDIEHEAQGLDDLLVLREEKSSPLVKKIDEWIVSMEGHYLESTTLGKAINYYIARHLGLHYFLTDKNVPIDNNMAERRQRCPVMGRKNFLHFKSINGADVGAFFYSVIESCKTNGLPGREYINEMAHRAINKIPLESPYQYSERLSLEIGLKLKEELETLSTKRGPP